MNMNNTPQFSGIQKESEISLLPILKILIDKRWFIIILTFAGFCFGALLRTLLYSKSYCASSFILLQSSQKVTNQDYSKVYFDSIVQNTCSIIVTSSLTVKNIILQEYTYEKNGQKVKTNLLGFYNEKDINRLADDKVLKNLKLSFDKKTQVLTISYIASNPDVASQIVNNVIKQINIFYNTQLTSDSTRNLKFVNEQLKIAKENLDTARLKLALFIKRNKEIVAVVSSSDNNATNTYSLAKLELQKLQEDAKVKEDLYNSLIKKSQDLGIQSEQNTPSVIVLQPAFPPQNPLPRQTLKYGTVGAFLMLLVAIGIVILRNLSEMMDKKENIIKLISDELSSDFKKLKKILIKNRLYR